MTPVNNLSGQNSQRQRRSSDTAVVADRAVPRLVPLAAEPRAGPPGGPRPRKHYLQAGLAAGAAAADERQHLGAGLRSGVPVAALPRRPPVVKLLKGESAEGSTMRLEDAEASRPSCWRRLPRRGGAPAKTTHDRSAPDLRGRGRCSCSRLSHAATGAQTAKSPRRRPYLSVRASAGTAPGLSWRLRRTTRVARPCRTPRPKTHPAPAVSTDSDSQASSTTTTASTPRSLPCRLRYEPMKVCPPPTVRRYAIRVTHPPLPIADGV